MSSEATNSLNKDQVFGLENLPSGGTLIIPSQLSGLDFLPLEKLLEGRDLIWVVEADAAYPDLVQARLQGGENSQTISIPKNPAGSQQAQEQIASAVQRGSTVIYLPPITATQQVPLCVVPGERLEWLMGTQVPVVPLYVQHNHDLTLSIEPEKTETDITVSFAPVLPPGQATVPAYQAALLQLSEIIFERKGILKVSLPYALLQGLKRHGGKVKVIEGKDETAYGFDKVLAAAIVLSKHVREVTQKERVGVLLPPGFGAIVANLAVLFAGKVPVNLNFTAGRASVESAMRQADLDHYLTADLFVRKLQSFPWPPNRQLTFIERLLPQKKAAMARWYILAKLLPTPVLATLLGISKKGGDKEALLLFTSGSSGEPKGVVLTHRNLIANVLQFGSRLNLKSQDGILGCLPMFHSFGCTVTLFFPIIQGVNLVTYPTPLETKKLAELIHKYKVTLFVSTPTFLRGYLKGVNPELLAPLKLVVTGAEKLPRTVADAFQARFGKVVLEGYGLTETSPVSNTNMPNPAPVDDARSSVIFPSHRPGSVGQLMPGLAVKITHLETDEPLPLSESGMIWFKGANVFTGYFKNQKKTDEVIKDGWFRTGDIGRLDGDGFLYVEGRLSRFSKVGGEMVPHETVEEALVKALNLESESNRRIAVVGLPDEDKGEALILLTSVPGGSVQQEILDLRYKLLDRGMPPLWIPKKMVRVPEIPILSSGKLDVKACEKLAKTAQ